MSQRTYVCPGDLRTDLLKLLAHEENGLDILLAAPGNLPRFTGLARVLDHPSTGVLPREITFAFRKAVLDSFCRSVDALPQTPAWQTLLRDWILALRTARTRVLHYCDWPLFTRLLSRPELSLVSAGPFDQGLLESERELTLQLAGETHRAARSWFEERTERALDISDEIRSRLESSWAGELLDPEKMYFKMLVDYFWPTIEGMDQEADGNPMLEHLTEFQVEAYEYAKGILRRFGGVFLADVVGLGKTFIGLALVRHLADRYGQHAVVVAPPNVGPAWRELAAEFKIEIATVSVGKLDDLEQYGDREVLVIDESHNFRNVGTRRYDAIQSWLRPDGAPSTRRIILLSATPQNNDPMDVRNQLAFFPDNFTRLPYRGESLDTWFHDVRRGAAALTELLQHVVVRRTRQFIRTAYPEATLRVRVGPGKYTTRPLRFPRRVSGDDQCLRYSINEAFGGNLYERILTTLRRLAYPLYGLGEYLRPATVTDPRVTGIRRSGASVRGLYKVLLLKRLESSVVAFRNTLRRLAAKLAEALARLDDGLVRVRQRVAPLTCADDDATDVTVEREQDVPAWLFHLDELRSAFEADASQVATLLAAMECLDATTDAKLQRLESYLASRRPNEHRTLLFTQFADTAAYLGRCLGQRYGRTEVVTGAQGNALRAARRFAPTANRAAVPADEQIELLVSTDALSEGVNLQDADTLINYDIHWNPVRMIQRAGRIDRIGSEQEEIHVASFLPEQALEARLGLETVLRRRIQEFLQVFGEDSQVLPSDEKLDEATVLKAYTGEAFEDEERADDMDGLSRHLERLMHLRRNRPDDYKGVLGLRRGRRSISAANAPALAATRLGWYWAFWAPDRPPGLSQITDLDGLDLMFWHAQAGPGARDALPRHENALADLVEQARARFAPLADQVRDQRARPVLSTAEQFILDRLEHYRRGCVESRKPLVERMALWVQEGHAKVHLRKVGATWKREALPAESVFLEVRPIFKRFPPLQEELGEVEVVGSVAGTGQRLQPAG